jgi:hypothetical protein
LSDLLPSSASLFERTLLAATDPTARIGDTIAALHGLKHHNPPPSLLPYLVYEYGLGELSPYVPNLYDLIDEGLGWQRIRGTHGAVAQALAWIGQAGAIEHAATRRRWWNMWQLALAAIPAEADLIRIEGLAQLSAPRRSDFWRGFRGYDARELELADARWGETLLGDQSGAVVAPGAARWSFGRRVEIDHDVTEAELTALGVWTEPVGGPELTWEVDAAWDDLDVSWVDDADLSRSLLMLAGAGTGPAWAVFKDAGGAVIGYRRALARRQVVPDSTGAYSVGASRYAPGAGTALYVAARTDFGDAAGSIAASVGFILSAVPASGQPVGARWLGPGGLAASGPIIAETAVTIAFAPHVREHVAALLRF